MGFLKYVGWAFKYHWNLLYLAVSGGIAFITGRPDIVLPAAAAIETAYIAILSTNQRFQNFVNAETSYNAKKTGEGPDKSKSANQILMELDADDRRKFRKLQSLYVEFGKRDADALGVSDAQMQNINRLLWIFLKLLYSKKSLEKFFAAINESELKKGLSSAREKLNALGPENEDDAREVKHRRSLADTVHTLEMRLNNYQAARDNYDFMGIEIDRLYSKIAGIAEMGVNRQEPGSISSEIDIVSASVLHTEQTMRELEPLRGVSFDEEMPPEMLTPNAPGRAERE